MTKAAIHLHSRDVALTQAGTWFGVMRAEHIRLKSSALQWFPLMGLLIGLLSSTFSLWTSGAQDALGLLSWQAMYITGMAAPMLALLAGIAEIREKKARFGGTNIRPVSSAKIQTARLATLIGISVLFHVFNFGITWIYAIFDHRDGAGVILKAGLLSWIGSLATIALFGVIARTSSLIVALLASALYQVAGTLSAESSWWWFFPPAWPVRLLLPTLGIHSNAVPLEQGHPLAEENAVASLALNISFAIAMTVLYIVFTERRTTTTSMKRPKYVSDDRYVSEQPTPGKARTGLFEHPVLHIRRNQSTRKAASPTGALVAIYNPLSKTAAPILAISILVVIYLVAVIYPPSYVSGLYTFAILPLGAGFLPVITWGALSPAWPIAVTENSHIRGAFLTWQSFLLLLLAISAGGAHLLSGGEFVQTIRMVVLWTLVGILLTTISTVLRIRFGSSTAIAATILGTVVSATLGGDILAETALWLIAVPAWPETADSSSRFVIALVIQAVIIPLATILAIRAIRDSERSG